MLPWNPGQAPILPRRVDGELPVGKQFFLMNFYPSLYEFQAGREIPW